MPVFHRLSLINLFLEPNFNCVFSELAFFLVFGCFQVCAAQSARVPENAAYFALKLTLNCSSLIEVSGNGAVCVLASFLIQAMSLVAVAKTVRTPLN